MKPPIDSKQQKREREEINIAQDQLVNISLRIGLDSLFAFIAEQEDMGFDPTITVSERGKKPKALILTNLRGQPCETAVETWQALIRCKDLHNDRERTIAFNELADRHGSMNDKQEFMLRLKSNGAKDAASIEEKKVRRGKGYDPSDVIRVTVFDSLPSQLSHFVRSFEGAVTDRNIEQGRPNHPKHTFWEMTVSGNLKYTFNAKLNGQNLELMVVPHAQADVASRITHKFLDITQAWDKYKAGRLPKEKKEMMIAEYNRVAEMMNKLSSIVPLSPSYVHTANGILATPDMSTVTLDVDTEGGRALDFQTALAHLNKAKGDEKPKFSPIFKNFGELQNFRTYVRDVQKKLPQFKYQSSMLPPLSMASSNEEIRLGMLRLTGCSQITHMCYLRQAPHEMRMIAVYCANKLNLRDGKPLPDEEKIMPQELIDDVKRGINGPEVTSHDLQSISKFDNLATHANTIHAKRR